MPDRYKRITTRFSPFQQRSIGVWNGEAYSQSTETTMPDGKKVVRKEPLRSGVSDANLSKIEWLIKKEDFEKIQSVKNLELDDPKVYLNRELWSYVFPLILSNPLEDRFDFTFAGMAESDGKRANVVDVTSLEGRTYRLFIDAESETLLLMIEKYSVSNPTATGETEKKYYFSVHKRFGDVQIPTRIKIEVKFTPKSGESVVSYENVEVTDFRLNAKIAAKDFQLD
jgi:hypothetical protein